MRRTPLVACRHEMTDRSVIICAVQDRVNIDRTVRSIY
jgi:hypothetical protein